MTTSEIRADMIGELRASARTAESICVFQRELAATGRAIAAQHRRQADRIESLSESHPSVVRAGGSKAATTVSKNIQGAVPPSAPSLLEEAA